MDLANKDSRIFFSRVTRFYMVFSIIPVHISHQRESNQLRWFTHFKKTRLNLFLVFCMWMFDVRDFDLYMRCYPSCINNMTPVLQCRVNIIYTSIHIYIYIPRSLNCFYRTVVERTKCLFKRIFSDSCKKQKSNNSIWFAKNIRTISGNDAFEH